jgi:hypothetical protein
LGNHIPSHKENLVQSNPLSFSVIPFPHPKYPTPTFTLTTNNPLRFPLYSNKQIPSSFPSHPNLKQHLNLFSPN